MNGSCPRWFPLAIVSIMAGAVFFSACSPLAAPTPTPTPGPLDAVKAYEKAFNAHDLSGLMALHADKVDFRKPEWGENHYGYEKVKNAYGVYFAINTVIHLSGCQVEKDGVTCQLTFTEDITRAAGVTDYPLKAVFRFDGEKIKEVVWNDPDVTSKANYVWNQYERDFLTWWHKTYPDEYVTMFQSLNAFWVTENGPITENRLKEYIAQLKK
jgi:hypothetical protein